MDFVKIGDMKKGLTITGFYLVKTAAIKNSMSGTSTYGDYTLADETGEINGKIWDVAEPESCPQAGSIIVLLTERGSNAGLYERILQPDGSYAWQAITAESADVPGFVARRRRFDPDLWVLELDIPDRERFAAAMNAVN